MTPDERRQLAVIETQLRVADPRLARALDGPLLRGANLLAYLLIAGGLAMFVLGVLGIEWLRPIGFATILLGLGWLFLPVEGRRAR